MRGKFPRGVDNGAGNDPDAASRTEQAVGGNTGDAVGSIQGDAYKLHSHGNATTYNNTVSGTTKKRTYTALGDRTTNSGGNETRPKNVYVNFIIKT